MVVMVYDDEVPVIEELVREMRTQYPPVEGSIALGAWVCKHGRVFEDWYYKEVICGLFHKQEVD